VRRVLLAAAVVATLAIGVTQAFGTGVRPTEASDDVFDSPGAIDEGFTAVLVNNGNNTHNVTADDKGPDGKPLFRTGNVAGGAMREIDGTQYLSAGSYDFYCSIHPSTMQDTLPVSDGLGTDPEPRPEISLKLKSKKLAKVVKSGKLKVKVQSEGPTAAQDISLKAKKGKKGITKSKKVNLAAGASKNVKLKLSDKGAGKLADLDSAKVKVQGTVAFGFGDKASKKLK
jgi:hypothetical protein